MDPLPKKIGDSLTAIALQTAKLAEREACIKIVMEHAKVHPSSMDCCEQIVDDIRRQIK